MTTPKAGLVRMAFSEACQAQALHWGTDWTPRWRHVREVDKTKRRVTTRIALELAMPTLGKHSDSLGTSTVTNRTPVKRLVVVLGSLLSHSVSLGWIVRVRHQCAEHGSLLHLRFTRLSCSPQTPRSRVRLCPRFQQRYL